MPILKDKFVNGALVGLILPVLVWGILYLFNYLMVQNATISSGWIGFKPSTVFLLAICANLLPTAIGNKRRLDDFIRGLLVVTMIFCLAWFFIYGTKTLGL